MDHARSSAERSSQSATAGVARPVAAAPDRPSPLHQMSRLHRTLGNQAVGRLLSVGRTIQRKCAACTEEDEEVHRKPASDNPVTTATDAAGMEAQLGSGRPLDAAVRSRMEAAFGLDFSPVRVHTDEAGARLSAGLNARAFTWANRIVFAAGAYQPGSRAGDTLLAHELTHVAQQAPVRSPALGASPSPKLMRKPDEPYHYPTPDEQTQIEETFFGRKPQPGPTPKPAPAPASGSPSPAEPAEHFASGGRSLNRQQAAELANQLKEPYYQAMDRLNSPISGPSPLDEPEAFKVVEEARQAVVKRYGRYASRNITLTQQSSAPRVPNQIPVVFTTHATEGQVSALALTLLTTHCVECKSALGQLDEKSSELVSSLMIAQARQEREAVLQSVADLRVPGSHNEGTDVLRLRLAPRDNLYHTAMHELIHALAHPAFSEAFEEKKYRDMKEGFTEYFTKQMAGGEDYADPVKMVTKVHDLMSGPYHFTGGEESAEESLRLAYFEGRLDLIGWVPTSPEKKKAVEDAGGRVWDPGIAEVHVGTYREQVQALQAPSRNVLGVGLYFNPTSDGKSINVRYARVLTRTEPYARGQLLLEGQLWGAPFRHPATLGASLGIAAEYQEPYFYAQAGARFIGSAVPGGNSTSLDASVFAGVGLRTWHKIRVGAEGFVLMSTKGDIGVGGGLTVGVELK